MIQSLIPKITRRHVSYGLSAQADVHAKNIRHDGVKTSFEVWYEDVLAGDITLNLPGEHNAANALAAVTVAKELEIGFAHIKAGLEGFTGVERRFQIRGAESGVMVVDDYGHHPEEIKAVLRAAKKGWGKRIIAVFQPHRFSRTKDLFEEFLSSFNDAEKLVITGDICGRRGELRDYRALYDGKVTAGRVFCAGCQGHTGGALGFGSRRGHGDNPGGRGCMEGRVRASGASQAEKGRRPLNAGKGR